MRSRAIDHLAQTSFLFRSARRRDYTRMKMMTELVQCRGASCADAVDTCHGNTSRAALASKHTTAYRGRRFLELALSDPWRANIVFQLAESVGDDIDSLSSYIDMLLALFPLWLQHQARELGGHAPADQQRGTQAKYFSWFNELGALKGIGLVATNPAGDQHV